jgi:alpha-1,3-mannosyltransferase
MKPIKVLHVTRVFDPIQGGIERFIHGLSIWGRKTGAFESSVCVISPKILQAPRYEIDGIPVFNVEAPGIGPFRILPDLASQVDQADIIHLHDMQVAGITWHFARRRYGPPVVLSTHGGFFHTSRLRITKKAYFRYVVPRLLSKIDLIIASSRSDAAFYAKASNRVVTIENGVDISKFSQAATEASQETNTFLHIGRLARNKRVEHLLKVVAALNEEGCITNLHLAGRDDDNLAAFLHLKAREYGIESQIHFHGAVSDARLIELTQSARFSCSASQYEGFGIAAVEAMAAGCIPLLSPIPSYRALIQDGVNGYLIDFGDYRGAAQRISSIMRQPETTLSRVRAAAQHRSADYAWADRIKEFEAAYRELIISRNRREINPKVELATGFRAKNL